MEKTFISGDEVCVLSFQCHCFFNVLSKCKCELSDCSLLAPWNRGCNFFFYFLKFYMAEPLFGVNSSQNSDCQHIRFPLFRHQSLPTVMLHDSCILVATVVINRRCTVVCIINRVNSEEVLQNRQINLLNKRPSIVQNCIFD